MKFLITSSFLLFFPLFFFFWVIKEQKFCEEKNEKSFFGIRYFQHEKLKINQLCKQTCVEVTITNTHTHTHL
jgi:hypothetical protein